MASILEEIFAAKREEVKAQRALVPLEALRGAAARAPKALPFASALRSRRLAIIAEIKRASPSRGDILPGLDPAAVARQYQAGGAAAISVLTDRHFKGTLDDLRRVRAAVTAPILRKDFVFDPYQVYEARAAGADCVLLIVAMLRPAQLRALFALARNLKMEALVEVHNRDQLELAEALGAEAIGINNRDLHSFTTDIATTEELLSSYRGRALIVSESGIESAAHVRRLARAGAHAFLVGESLLRAGNPRAALTALTGALKV